MDSVDLETPLSKWMREANVSAYEVARRTRISYKQVCKIRDGECFPSLISAFRIDQATGGKVAPVMWLGTPTGRKLWAEGHDWEKWQEQRRDEQRRNRARQEADQAAKDRDLNEGYLHLRADNAQRILDREVHLTDETKDHDAGTTIAEEQVAFRKFCEPAST